MPSVGPERKGGIPQGAQVTNFLAVSRSAKLGLLQDSFLQLRVCDLAIRHGSRAAQQGNKPAGDYDCWKFHDFRPVREQQGTTIMNVSIEVVIWFLRAASTARRAIRIDRQAV